MNMMEDISSRFGLLPDAQKVAREVLGYRNPASVRRSITTGNFPLRTRLVAGRHVVAISDLCAFLADPVGHQKAEGAEPPARRSGRPSKAEMAAARAAGVSVSVLRKRGGDENA